MDNKITSEQFATAIGRRAIAKAVGVLPTAVSNAVVRGTFPASWYYACQKLAEQKNVPFPAEMFGQRGIGNTPFVDRDPKVKDSSRLTFRKRKAGGV